MKLPGDNWRRANFRVWFAITGLYIAIYLGVAFEHDARTSEHWKMKEQLTELDNKNYKILIELEKYKTLTSYLYYKIKESEAKEINDQRRNSK